MGTMAVSFRFKDDTTREARYDSFMERIRSKGVVWEETTSFVLVEISMTAAELEWELWIKTKFSHITDKMIVIDVTSASASTRGPIDYPSTLRSLLPKVAINTSAS
jgi:hypothetical protein